MITRFVPIDSTLNFKAISNKRLDSKNNGLMRKLGNEPAHMVVELIKDERPYCQPY
jgi:hypothetical protein